MSTLYAYGPEIMSGKFSHGNVLRLLLPRSSMVKCHKVPKFSDARKLCCNTPKIQTQRPNHSAFRKKKDSNEIANS